MELPGRMEVERRAACPHCRKLLPDFSLQEIVESHEFPLRCGECRKVVEFPVEFIEQARQRMTAGE